MEAGKVLLILALGLVVLFGVGFAMRFFAPPSPEVTAEDRHVVVHVRGLDVIWPMKRRIAIPYGNIVTIGVRSLDKLPETDDLLDGPYQVGDARTGEYGPKDARELWLLRNSHEVVYIETREPMPYRRIILQVDDARETITHLRSMVSLAR